MVRVWVRVMVRVRVNGEGDDEDEVEDEAVVEVMQRRLYSEGEGVDHLPWPEQSKGQRI